MVDRLKLRSNFLLNVLAIHRRPDSVEKSSTKDGRPNVTSACKVCHPLSNFLLLKGGGNVANRPVTFNFHNVDYVP